MAVRENAVTILCILQNISLLISAAFETVGNAIGEINDQSDRNPYAETDPSHIVQRHH